MTEAAKRQEGRQPSDGRLATINVWDPIVRIFHWTVVTACVLNLFILEAGHYWHRMTGYAVAVALTIRLIWGFVGTRHARFTDFFPTPLKVTGQIVDILNGSEKRSLGHSPLASVMMLVLMLLLVATCLTGWMMTLDAFWGEKWLQQLHGLIANSIMVLAFVHAGAALVESRRHKENLIWSMVTGRKRA